MDSKSAKGTSVAQNSDTWLCAEDINVEIICGSKCLKLFFTSAFICIIRISVFLFLTLKIICMNISGLLFEADILTQCTFVYVCISKIYVCIVRDGQESPQ